MGTNNLNADSDGNIADAADVNQYRTALNGDLVPRNSSGVATDEAGSIGTAALRWLNAYFKTLFLDDGTTTFSLEHSSTNLLLKRGSDLLKQFGAMPLQTNGSDPGVSGLSISSSSSGFSTSSLTYVDVTNLSVTLTTTGRPVEVGLISDLQTSIVSEVSVNNTGGIAAGLLRFLENGSQLNSDMLIEAHDEKVAVPAGAVRTIATPAAGTHTYKLQARRSSGFIRVQQCVLFAREL